MPITSTTQPADRRDDRRPVALIIGAVAVCAFLVAAYVAVLPDHIAPADEAARRAWTGD